jgi:branched-chain amino acid transport system permease protein
MGSNLTVKKMMPLILISLSSIFLMVVPLFASSFMIHFLILLLMYTALATAWNWIGGYAGQVSVGHAVFFGLGAYSTGLANGMFHLNPWIGLFIGIVISVMFAFLIGIPTFHTRGLYFVIATLAINEIMFSLFMGWRTAGGGSGYFIPMKEASILNFQFSTKTPYFYIILIFFALSIGITLWLERSKIGYYLRAIKGDQDAAMAIGVNLKFYKQFAMTMSAAMTALIGAFWANYILFIDPGSCFSSTMSTRILLSVVVGGVGTLYGPIIGVLIIIPLTEGSRMLLGGYGSGIDSVLYGLLIMIIAALKPEGIMGFVKSYKRKIHLEQKQNDQRREGSDTVDVTSS